MPEICPNCAAWFVSPTVLAHHVRAVHPSGDPTFGFTSGFEPTTPTLVCGRCGARFRAKEMLARHNLAPHRRLQRGLSAAPFSHPSA